MWRSMRPSDLAAVKAVSDAVHGAYTEAQAVYAERLALYPAGCMAYAQDDLLLGYLIAHPWRHEGPPALNRLLEGIPATADIYAIHDLALLPTVRGQGAGLAAIALVIEQARADGFDRLMLTAVNGADRFWRSQGFVAVPGGADVYGAGSLLMERRI